MSELFSGSELRGKKRREVIPPLELPKLDTDGLRSVQGWRIDVYKQPILDNLLGFYRFDPPTKSGANVYTNSHRKFIGSEGVPASIVQQYVQNPEQVENAAIRQMIHKAESTELATALFWSVAVLRSEVLGAALDSVGKGTPMDEDIATYSADAIVDMGLCLESPYESNWKLRTSPRQRKYPQGLRTKLDTMAPGIGANVVDFGAYADKHPSALYSDDGYVALHAAYIEQDYRINTWGPRHTAITEAYPDLPLSKEILYMALSLSEMLDIQDRLEEVA